MANNLHINSQSRKYRADAVALHDWRNAQRLQRVISLGSREILKNRELRYGARLLDLEVNPLSEALLWAEVPGRAGRPSAID